MDNFKRVAELVLSGLGMIGNLLLMVAWWRTRADWHRLNLQLVGPIAVIDCMSSFLGILKAILSFAIGNEELFDTTWFCSYFGTPILILPCLSMLLVSIMSLDRYCLVVHGRGMKCFWGWIFILLLSSFFICLLVANTAVYGLVPDPTRMYCRPSGSSILTFFAHRLATCIIMIGLFVVTFCYIAIYLRCRMIATVYQIMTVKYIFILLAYQLCWLPKFISSLWGLFTSTQKIPQVLLHLGPFGLILLLIANPCLVFGLQASLRKEAYTILSQQKPSAEDQTCLDSDGFKDLSLIPQDSIVP
ncbi:hypothetical protein DSO57_1022608 [Entomophthora muscae]|uniref:Uncharacterized protein n=1 Tax=Entomophthora muscae TaxID=34485 RepID=A0ACC2RHT8_9FUNG|nr:hypothetical protein DSO57_1022608 [Entomophthora muscae]